MFLAIAVLMIAASSSVTVTIAEARAREVSDRKSFKTVPFVPEPSDAQRRDLERAIDLCVKTVEGEVPGGGLSVKVEGGIVNTVGIDRERFKFWKCMSENGHPLAPINKSGD